MHDCVDVALFLRRESDRQLLFERRGEAGGCPRFTAAGLVRRRRQDISLRIAAEGAQREATGAKVHDLQPALAIGQCHVVGDDLNRRRYRAAGGFIPPDDFIGIKRQCRILCVGAAGHLPRQRRGSVACAARSDYSGFADDRPKEVGDLQPVVCVAAVAVVQRVSSATSNRARCERSRPACGQLAVSDDTLCLYRTGSVEQVHCRAAI